MVRSSGWAPSSCVFRKAYSAHSALSTHCTDLLETSRNTISFFIQCLGPCTAYIHREVAMV